MRWEDYIMRGGADHERFWDDHLRAKRDLLYVVASGFDPRMCDGAESIMKKGGRGKRDCRLIRFYEENDPDAALYADLIRDNTRRLEGMLDQRQIQTVKVPSGANKPIDIQRLASGAIKDGDLEAYTDIVVDVSSMQTQTFFPLLGDVLIRLARADSPSGRQPNLFVVVSEDLGIDKAITKSGLDEEASFVHGFLGSASLRTAALVPAIWIPLLGENRGDELELVRKEIKPAETCPVVPSPSLDPRRGDRMLLEHRELLRRVEADRRSMIYASERNPFDVYRQIYDTVVHYDTVLRPLGDYRFVISPMSSKLMSIGALLAAYELTYEEDIRQEIALVGASKYYFERPSGPRRPDLFTVWVSGECYEP